MWWPLLGGLAGAIHDSRAAVRTAALQALFTCLNVELTSDGVLSGQLGREAYRAFVLTLFVVLPTVAPADEPPGEGGEGGEGVPPSTISIEPAAAEWLATTGLAVLAAAERCFCSASNVLGPELLDELITLLVRCLQQRHTPPLAHAAAEALLHLVKETGAAFSQGTWASVCAELKTCFEGDSPTLPPPPAAALAAAPPSEDGLVVEVSQRVQKEAPPGSGPHELQVLLLSTVYQLLLLNHPLMKLSDLEGLLNCLHSMYEKSHRTVMDALGGEVLPRAELDEAIMIELEAMAHYLQILLTFFGKLTPDAAPPAEGVRVELGSDQHLLLIGAAAEYRLVSFCLHVLREYLKVHEAAVVDGGATSMLAQRLLGEMTPAVVTLLQGLLGLHEPQLVRHLPGFLPLFFDLMQCDSKEVRQTLRDIFSRRVGPVLHERQQAL